MNKIIILSIITACFAMPGLAKAEGLPYDKESSWRNPGFQYFKKYTAWRNSGNTHKHRVVRGSDLFDAYMTVVVGIHKGSGKYTMSLERAFNDRKHRENHGHALRSCQAVAVPQTCTIWLNWENN